MATINCTGLSDESLLMCNALTFSGCANSEYLESPGVCVPYASPIEKMQSLLGEDAALNSGNTAFMLGCTTLVMIMTPGVGLFYGGLAGESTVSNTLLMSFASMCIVTFQWFLFGYSVSFGLGGPGIGSLDWFSVLPITGKPSGVYGVGIPHLLWVVFQCQFAQITPALISGALIGRMKFSSYCLFVLLWTSLIYDPLSHWFWSLAVFPDFTSGVAGWLGQLGAIDFAGGSVIHISSGFAALAAAIVLGPRYNVGEKVKPHNVPMVMMGTMLLWFGWFGFNGGSAGGAASFDGTVSFGNTAAALAILNTHLAAASSGFTWLVVEKLHSKTVTAAGMCSGIVAGLVVITPACAFATTYGAILMGIIVAPVCYGAVILKGKMGIDDTLDSWAIHGVGGFMGSALTGLFAYHDVYIGAFYGDGGKILGANLLGAVVAAAYSFFGTLVIMLVLKFTIGVRINDEIEKEGIDKSEHGGKAYEQKNTTAM